MKHNRNEPRYQCFTERSIGTFFINNNPILAHPIDVSKRGVGILVNIELKPQTLVTWKLANQNTILEVAYCSNHLGIDSLFKVGLFSREPNNNLLDLVEQAGFKDKLEVLSYT
jgi:hypothetical protein